MNSILPRAVWQPGLVGAFAGIPFKDYLAAPGLSNSARKHLHPTPAHYKAYQDAQDDADDDPQNANLIIGTLVHQTILLPEDPWPQIAVKTRSVDYRTSAGKE